MLWVFAFMGRIVGFVNCLAGEPVLLLSVVTSFNIVVNCFSFFGTVVCSTLYVVLVFVLVCGEGNRTFVFYKTLLSYIVLSADCALDRVRQIRGFSGNRTMNCFAIVRTACVGASGCTFVTRIGSYRPLGGNSGLLVCCSKTRVPINRVFGNGVRLRGLRKATTLDCCSSNICNYASLDSMHVSGRDGFILDGVSLFEDFVGTRIFDNFSSDRTTAVLTLLANSEDCFDSRFCGGIGSSNITRAVIISNVRLSVVISFVLCIVGGLFCGECFGSFIVFTAIVLIATIYKFAVSVVHTSLACLLIYLTLLLGQRDGDRGGLNATISIVLVFGPLTIFGITFRLSILSAFKVLTITLPVVRFVGRGKLVGGGVLGVVTTTSVVALSTGILALPIATSIFKYISGIKLITGLLVSCTIALTLILYVAKFVMCPLHGVVFTIAGLVIACVGRVVGALNSLPFTACGLPGSTIVMAMVLVFIVFFVLLTYIERGGIVGSGRVVSGGVGRNNGGLG